MLKLLILQIPRHIVSPCGYIWLSSHPSRSFIWNFYRPGITPSHPFPSETAWNRFNLEDQPLLSPPALFFTHKEGFVSRKCLLLHFNLFHLCRSIIHSKWMVFGSRYGHMTGNGYFSLASAQVLTDLISDVCDVFRHSEWADIRTSCSWSLGSHSVKCQCFNGSL